MNTTKHEKTIKELFLNECWEYLRDNFHKFNETNKIKIALTLAQKDLPQEISGMQQTVIVSASIQKEIPGESGNANRLAEYFSGPTHTPAST